MESVKRIKRLLTLCLLLAPMAQAKTGTGQDLDLGVNAQISEDVVVGIRAEGYFGNHPEQFDQIHPRYDSSGSSGTEFAFTGKLILGSIGKATITGVGEVAVYNRTIADSAGDDSVTTAQKFRQYLPRTGINIRVPVSGGFAVEFNNLFERRLISIPEPYTFWVWRPQMRLLGPEMTAIKLSPYVDYEGFDHKDLRYLACNSYGIKGQPMDGLDLDLSYRIFWKPEEKNTTTHGISLRAGYTFDLTHKN